MQRITNIWWLYRLTPEQAQTFRDELAELNVRYNKLSEGNPKTTRTLYQSFDVVRRKSRGKIMLIGIDWGGTKIEGVAMREDGTELLRLREVTPRHDYSGCIKVVKQVIDKLEAANGRAWFYWYWYTRVFRANEWFG